jgi:phosphate/sulfate permease
MITWYCGLPSSSSHALICGYAGSATVKSGFGVIIAGGDIYRVGAHDWSMLGLFIKDHYHVDHL